MVDIEYWEILLGIDKYFKFQNNVELFTIYHCVR